MCKEIEKSVYLVKYLQFYGIHFYLLWHNYGPIDWDGNGHRPVKIQLTEFRVEFPSLIETIIKILTLQLDKELDKVCLQVQAQALGVLL